MDNSFRKEERLCLKRRFELLLKDGRSFFLYPFRVIYLENAFEPADFPVQVAFAVKKKQFRRAVWRNTIKRRCREAYRLNKHSLYQNLNAGNKTLLILFVYSADTILSFEEIGRKMSLILNRFKTIVKDPA